jgi:hypothetical protein
MPEGDCGNDANDRHGHQTLDCFVGPGEPAHSSIQNSLLPANMLVDRE